MKFLPTPLPGAFIVEIEPIGDERGFFAEAWKQEEAARHGIEITFNRSNVSHNTQRGTIRGLHAQRDPHSEAKLVRCIRGSVYDVIVDVRPDSPACGQWFGIELSADNHRMLYVPRGFLHGFQTLENDSTVYYDVAGHYTPGSETGARYDDPAFNITWPVQGEPILSPKDAQWAPFQPLSSAVSK